MPTLTPEKQPEAPPAPIVEEAPLKGGRADEAGNVGETGDLAAGQTKTIALKLKVGHDALICDLPGHYKVK